MTAAGSSSQSCWAPMAGRSTSSSGPHIAEGRPMNTYGVPLSARSVISAVASRQVLRVSSPFSAAEATMSWTTWVL